VLGVLQDNPAHYLQSAATADGGLGADKIEDLIQQRLLAKQNKNWAEADRIRDELKAQGVVLEDKGKETSWRRE
jgi:cysteinyl-tRNA synthetase